MFFWQNKFDSRVRFKPGKVLERRTEEETCNGREFRIKNGSRFASRRPEECTTAG